MTDHQKADEKNLAAGEKSAFTAPSISLPKGGGAIHGIGEKFAANPVTGTGSMSIPIATSPGRSGFGPQLSLSYDSGSGNSPFGFGWSCSTPSISYKTAKGLPTYQPQDDNESGVFILSGTEDLVPEFRKKAHGNWMRDPKGNLVIFEDLHEGYCVRRYRPRIEGLFARIERWTNVHDPKDVYWRSISKDNILTLYGKDVNSRIFDPEDASHIFSWLICETRDDKGNAVIYEYKPEDSAGINLQLTHERNRGDLRDPRRTTNRYLKHIRYGNRVPLVDDSGQRPRILTTMQIQNAGWMFEVVFDYGEHDVDLPKPDEAGQWAFRDDPFSSYRSGFEVRTTRICQRVLMFHHFPDVEEVGNDCLVRSTDFSYSNEQNPKDARNPVYTFLLAVTQTGYKRQTGGYLKRSLPPVEYEYTQPIVQDTIYEVDAESLENLPTGLDEKAYQWTDLHGEGIPGILTEQGGAWFYKRNLSPINNKPGGGAENIEAKFAPVELVVTQPNLTLASGAQFMDLAGDGLPDLVMLDGPMPGLYEHDGAESWQPFRPFTARLNRNLRDPNLKFIDLDGDGHADVLITEDDAFVWHPSLAEYGFGSALHVYQSLDEEKGPRLILADGSQSVYLSDMSGDGLTDLVRIRNGEICYWPNLGYGRFGAKVTMDNSPWFEIPDLFDHKRVRLADIDGSGTTDIIYLHREGVRLYFNQSGNSLSGPQILKVFPRVDDLINIMPADLLGNGTACLVWSSPLPGDSQQQMRYVNLMGGQKPHLLIGVKNNLGAETRVQYAPSTRFYLQDKREGKPWITKLPFPVHCVEKVTITDKWRGTRFSTSYSYHHGYYDGEEREFRGFGRVEQMDVESYGEFERGNTASPYITNDKTLFQPPVKTTTWYHTGAFLDRKRILSHFAHEYFPHWLNDRHPDFNFAFLENQLPQPDLEAENLSVEEWREALRACKGMMLRQEVVELDIDTLERTQNPEQLPVKLFSTAYHNCHIRLLQPKGQNLHAVFLAAESEAITYHYELDIREEQLPWLNPDPRIAHTLNLQFDEYGNILQSVLVAYPRLGHFEDNHALVVGLSGSLSLIHQVQNEEIHLAYSETRYTEDFGTRPADDQSSALDNYRLRVPCEVLTYELSGIKHEAGLHLTLNGLRTFQLSQIYQKSGTPVPEIPYHQIPDRSIPEKRLVEHTRTLFFAENLVDPLPFGEHGRLGLTYEAYKLAMTEALLDAVYTDAAGNNKLDQIIDGAISVRAKLDDPTKSGYLSGEKLEARFSSLPATELIGQYWIRSGIAGFASDAAQHFYLPERYTDPFGNITTLAYDPRDLFVLSSTDAMGNTTRVTQFDFRVLAPREMQDINNNLSEMFFDVLGLPTAMALKGKGTEGDNLIGFTDALAAPELTSLTDFFVEEPYNEVQARDWLGNATARHVYYFGETIQDGKITWAAHPACACGIVRERHVAQLEPGENSRLQAAFEYSDGMGSVVVKKVQAEPETSGQPMRWVANGKTILNNKSKPVKQYEPYFSPPEVGHRFEEPREEGVTPVIYYDAAGRVIRTESPDGSYSRVEFSPWYVRTFDQNDTVKEPGNAWFAMKSNGTSEEQRAAKLAADHANTPSLTIFDSLGRDVISIAHNRVKDAAGGLKDEKYLTFTKLDAEGKPLWIRDARKNLVMQYIAPPVANNQAADPVNGFAPCYDIAGNLLYQHSMDAGDRWTLNDASGKAISAWDNLGHLFYTDYDPLHRPSASFVKGADPQIPNRLIQFEKLVYGDTLGNGLVDVLILNLCGKTYQHYDTAGIATSLGRNPLTGTEEAYDFNGNLLRSTRQLVKDYKTTPDWSQNPDLETETFTSSTRYDALNRPIQLVAPHSNHPDARINIVRPAYNEANLLECVDVWLDQTAESTTLLYPSTANLKAITNIDYDAKGQRVRIDYNEANHPIVTQYTYDKDTFRLTGMLSTRPIHLETERRKLQDLSYTYDPVGNITNIRDVAQQTVFFNNTSIAPSNAYTYDALYRLIHAEGREHAAQNNIQGDAKKFEPLSGIPFLNSPEALQRYFEDYEYDGVGNILGLRHAGGQAERWVRWYQYALDSNRLLATRSPGDASKLPFYSAAPGYGARYDYDVHGNMTIMPHLPSMTWDFKNQLQITQRQVVNDPPPAGKAPVTTYYVYDAVGQRVRKVTERQSGMLKEERIYLGGFEVYRKYNGDGETVTLERETLHVMDDKKRVALIETRTLLVGVDPAPAQLVRFQLNNHLGSAALELDDQARVISYEEYHPYGTTAYETARSLSETPKRYRFTGKEQDEETGFMYHGARYYASWLGRWVSCDPAGVEAGINLYNGFMCAPTNFVDPSGAWPELIDNAVSVANKVAAGAMQSTSSGIKEVLGATAPGQVVAGVKTIYGILTADSPTTKAYQVAKEKITSAVPATHVVFAVHENASLRAGIETGVDKAVNGMIDKVPFAHVASDIDRGIRKLKENDVEGAVENFGNAGRHYSKQVGDIVVAVTGAKSPEASSPSVAEPPAGGNNPPGGSEPLFPNLSADEVNVHIENAEGGTGFKLPGQNPLTGEGLLHHEPNATATNDPAARIAHADESTFTGIKGAGGKPVEVRRHSADKGAADPSYYSASNPVTVVNTVKVTSAGTVKIGPEGQTYKGKYMDPSGNFIKPQTGTPSQQAAKWESVHYP